MVTSEGSYTLEFQEDIFREADPYFEMFQCAFEQGIEYAIEALKRKDLSHQDILWILNTDNHIYGFDWYCSVFSLEPQKVYEFILSEAGFASISDLKREWRP